MTNALGSWIQRISISSCNNRSANHLSAIARIPLTFRVAIFILVYKIINKRGVKEGIGNIDSNLRHPELVEGSHSSIRINFR